MADDAGSQKAAGKKKGEKLRDQSLFPPLALDSNDPLSPSYRTLTMDDDLYPLAAWVLHHAHALDPDVLRGLYIALAVAWPHTRGRHTNVAQRQVWSLLHEAGVSDTDIADTWCVTVPHVRDVIRDRERQIMDMEDDDRRYSVYIDSEDQALPPDPSGHRGQRDYPREPPSLDDIDRANKIAAGQGFESFDAMMASLWPRLSALTE